MRLRNVTGSREVLAESEFVIQKPKLQKGKWSQIFKNNNPIYIEVGMGKGKFITTLAAQNPDINYIGVEKYSSVLIRALEKREQMENCKNLYFVRMDAEEITDIFDRNEVSGIYLNFSDPWPKDRHAKRRLTSKQFFTRYAQILKPDGEVQFKTDNADLFDFSVESIKDSKWKIIVETRDLHHSEWAEGNVMTEYEEKFSQKGNPICKLVAVR